MDEILKQLYENGSVYYSLPDFETFKLDMQNEDLASEFRDNMSAYYSMPNEDEFLTDIGLREEKLETVAEDVAVATVDEPATGDMEFPSVDYSSESTLDQRFPAPEIGGLPSETTLVPGIEKIKQYSPELTEQQLNIPGLYSQHANDQIQAKIDELRQQSIMYVEPDEEVEVEEEEEDKSFIEEAWGWGWNMLGEGIGSFVGDVAYETFGVDIDPHHAEPIDARFSEEGAELSKKVLQKELNNAILQKEFKMNFGLDESGSFTINVEEGEEVDYDLIDKTRKEILESNKQKEAKRYDRENNLDENNGSEALLNLRDDIKDTMKDLEEAVEEEDLSKIEKLKEKLNNLKANYNSIWKNVNPDGADMILDQTTGEMINRTNASEAALEDDEKLTQDANTYLNHIKGDEDQMWKDWQETRARLIGNAGLAYDNNKEIYNSSLLGGIGIPGLQNMVADYFGVNTRFKVDPFKGGQWGDVLEKLGIESNPFVRKWNEQLNSLNHMQENNTLADNLTYLPGNSEHARKYNQQLKHWRVINKAMLLNQDPSSAERRVDLLGLDVAFIPETAEAIWGGIAEKFHPEYTTKLEEKREFTDFLQYDMGKELSDNQKKNIARGKGPFGMLPTEAFGEGYADFAQIVLEFSGARSIMKAAMPKGGGASNIARMIKNSAKTVPILNNTKLARGGINMSAAILEEAAVIAMRNEAIAKPIGEEKMDLRFAVGMGMANSAMKGVTIGMYSTDIGKRILHALDGTLAGNLASGTIQPTIGTGAMLAGEFTEKFLTNVEEGGGLLNTKRLRKIWEETTEQDKVLSTWMTLWAMRASKSPLKLVTEPYKLLSNDILRSKGRTVEANKAAKLLKLVDYMKTDEKGNFILTNNKISVAGRKILKESGFKKGTKEYNKLNKKVKNSMKELNSHIDLKWAQKRIKQQKGGRKQYRDLWAAQKKLQSGLDFTDADVEGLGRIGEIWAKTKLLDKYDAFYNIRGKRKSTADRSKSALLGLVRSAENLVADANNQKFQHGSKERKNYINSTLKIDRIDRDIRRTKEFMKEDKLSKSVGENQIKRLELDKVKERSKLDNLINKQADFRVEQRKINIELAKQTAEGTSFENRVIELTEKDINEGKAGPDNITQKLKSEGWFQGKDKKIYINTDWAEKVKNITVATHEILHPVLDVVLDTMTTSERNKYVKNFVDLLPSEVKDMIEPLVKDHPDYKNGKNPYTVEWINIFSDITSAGEVGYSKDIFGKLSNSFSKLFKDKTDFTNADFKDPKQAYEFVKAFSEQARKGKLRSDVASRIKKGLKEYKSKDIERLSKTEALAERAEILDNQKKLMAEGKTESLQFRTNADAIKELTAKIKGEELVEKGKVKDLTPTERKTFITNQGKQLNELWTKDLRNLERINKIWDKVIENHAYKRGLDKLPDFKMDEFIAETQRGFSKKGAERGLGKFIWGKNKYDPSKGDSFFAYVNSFLKISADNALKSGKVTSKVFKEELSGREKELEPLTEVPTAEVPTAESIVRRVLDYQTPAELSNLLENKEISKEQHDSQLEKYNTLENKVVDYIKKEVIKDKEIDTSKLDKNLNDYLRNELAANIRKEMGKPSEYEGFLKKVYKDVLKPLSEAPGPVNDMFTRAKMRDLFYEGTGKRYVKIKGKSQPELMRKLTPTERDVLDYYLKEGKYADAPNSKGNLKIALSNMLAETMGKDLMPELIREGKIFKWLNENQVSKIEANEILRKAGEELRRDPELKFSETLETFTDDTSANIETIKEALKMLDAKSKVQRTKVKFSKSLKVDLETNESYNKFRNRVANETLYHGGSGTLGDFNAVWFVVGDVKGAFSYAVEEDGRVSSVKVKDLKDTIIIPDIDDARGFLEIAKRKYPDQIDAIEGRTYNTNKKDGTVSIKSVLKQPNASEILNEFMDWANDNFAMKQSVNWRANEINSLYDGESITKGLPVIVVAEGKYIGDKVSDIDMRDVWRKEKIEEKKAARKAKISKTVQRVLPKLKFSETIDKKAKENFSRSEEELSFIDSRDVYDSLIEMEKEYPNSFKDWAIAWVHGKGNEWRTNNKTYSRFFDKAILKIHQDKAIKAKYAEDALENFKSGIKQMHDRITPKQLEAINNKLPEGVEITREDLVKAVEETGSIVGGKNMGLAYMQWKNVESGKREEITPGISSPFKGEVYKTVKVETLKQFKKMNESLVRFINPDLLGGQKDHLLGEDSKVGSFGLGENALKRKYLKYDKYNKPVKDGEGNQLFMTFEEKLELFEKTKNKKYTLDGSVANIYKKVDNSKIKTPKYLAEKIKDFEKGKISIDKLAEFFTKEDALNKKEQYLAWNIAKEKWLNETYVKDGKPLKGAEYKKEFLQRYTHLLMLAKHNTNLVNGERMFLPTLAIYIGKGMNKSFVGKERIKLEHLKTSLKQSLDSTIAVLQGKFSTEGKDIIKDYIGIFSPEGRLDIIDIVGGKLNSSVLSRMSLDLSELKNYYTIESGLKETLYDKIIRDFGRELRLEGNEINLIKNKQYLADYVVEAMITKTPTSKVKLKQALENWNDGQKAFESNEGKLAFSSTKKSASRSEQLEKGKAIDKALENGRKLDTPVKKIRVFDFDDTLATTKSRVLYTMPDGKKGQLNATEFAKRGDDLNKLGAEFDFSEFSKVMKGGKGPLLEVAKMIKESKGERDMFVLTARPAESAKSIHEFLKGVGLDIPIENITGLGDGASNAKARWMIEKAAEGYNDFYFADDHTGNIKAVKDALSQLDVKSKVQQAKFSSTIDKEFNKIIEIKTGIDAVKEYSDVKAKLVGAKKKRFKFFIPPSAEDFMGLLYATLPKGEAGNKAMDFYKENLFNPYSRAIENLSTDRTNLMQDFKALKKQLAVPKDLRKVTKSGFTNEQAVRVYLWGKEGKEIPGISKTDLKELNDIIEKDPKLKAFGDQILNLTKGDGYSEPGKHWQVGTITTDLINVLNTTKRSKYLSEWKQNTDVIFSNKNLNKLEAVYGQKYREALENMLSRMKSGKNRTAGGNKLSNQVLDYINQSQGAIMFLNMRSAALQTISSINFVNWEFNNPLKAGQAFANQKQYWKDFVHIMNSDYLIDRRNGLKLNISESEIADAAATSKNKAKAGLNYILEKGYIATKFADSFAIASGGATFYRNRVKNLMKNNPEMELKEAEKQAFQEMRDISEISQQSADPARISQQQASDLGRVTLQFVNTPMQYARLQKRAFQDLANRRGDAKSNVSKIIYYGFVQNLIFNGLQQAIFALGFGDDEISEKEEKQLFDVGNGMADSILRGIGLGGVSVSVLKNLGIDIYERTKKTRPEYSDAWQELLGFSPSIKKKLANLKSAGWPFDSKKRRKEVYDKGFSLDNPAYESLAQVITAATNLPLDRLFVKVNNLKEAVADDTELWQSVAMVLGWPEWNIKVKKEDQTENKKKKLKSSTNKGEQRKLLKELGYSDWEINSLKKEDDRVEAIISVQSGKGKKKASSTWKKSEWKTREWK